MPLHSQPLPTANDSPPGFPARLLVVWLPPETEVHQSALRALTSHVRREYGAGVTLKRQRWASSGCRLQLHGPWGTVSPADVHAELARLWAEQAGEE